MDQSIQKAVPTDF